MGAVLCQQTWKHLVSVALRGKTTMDDTCIYFSFKSKSIVLPHFQQDGLNSESLQALQFKPATYVVTERSCLQGGCGACVVGCLVGSRI